MASLIVQQMIDEEAREELRVERLDPCDVGNIDDPRWRDPRDLNDPDCLCGLRFLPGGACEPLTDSCPKHQARAEAA